MATAETEKTTKSASTKSRAAGSASDAAAPASGTAGTAVPSDITKKRALRRRLRKTGREKLTTKLRSDKEFAKTFFEGRSKRSTEKKASFRKKKSRKK